MRIIIMAFVILPIFIKAQNCDSLLFYYRNSGVLYEQNCKRVDNLYSTYKKINLQVPVMKAGDSCSELLKLLASSVYQSQVEKEFAFCDFALSYAQKLLLLKDSTMAYTYYRKVYNYGFNFAKHNDTFLQSRYFDYLVASGKGIIESIRYNKEKLASTNPYLFDYVGLRQFYEAALKEVGLEPKY